MKRLSILPTSEPRSDDGYHLMVHLVERVTRASAKPFVLAQTREAIRELCLQLAGELQKLKDVLSGGDEEVEARQHEDIGLSAETYRAVLPEIEALMHKILNELSLISSEKRQLASYKLLCNLVGLEVLDTLITLLKALSTKFEEIGMERKFKRRVKERCIKEDKAAALEELKALVKTEEIKSLLPNESELALQIFSSAEEEGLDAKATLARIENSSVLRHLHRGIVTVCENGTARIPEECLEIKGFLAKGSFGPIMEGNLRGDEFPDEPLVVGKIMARVPFLSIAARREVQVHSLKNSSQKFRNNYLVHMYGTCILEQRSYLVFERCQRSLGKVLFGDLDEGDDVFGFSNRRILSYTVDIASGLKFLHSQSTYHGSLDPSNIFMDSDNHLVLANFGFQKTKLEYMRHANRHQMTYMAPEVIDPREQVWTYAADVYALGMVMYEMIEFVKALEDLDFEELIVNVKQKQLRPVFASEKYTGKQLPSFLKNLVNLCWAHNSKNRPTAKEVEQMIDVQLKSSSSGKARKSFQKWFGADENLDEKDTSADVAADILSRGTRRAPKIEYLQSSASGSRKTPEDLVKLLEASENDREEAVEALKEVTMISFSTRRMRPKLIEEGVDDAILEVMAALHEEVDVQVEAFRALRSLARGQKRAAVAIKKSLVGKGVHESVIKALLNVEDDDRLIIAGCRLLWELSIKAPDNIEAIVQAKGVELICSHLNANTKKLHVHKVTIRALFFLIKSEAGKAKAIELGVADSLEALVKANDALEKSSRDMTIAYFGPNVLATLQANS